MKYVNAPVMKKDAMALVTGQPVYMDDLAPKDCLIRKSTQKPACPCTDRGDPYRKCCKTEGHCLCPHLPGCPEATDLQWQDRLTRKLALMTVIF